MKRITRIAALLAALFAFAGPALRAQSPTARAYQSYNAGIFNSQAYAFWTGFLLTGNSATGSQTVTICPALVVLPDGRSINPYATNVPITVDNGSTVSETVTPSAVSVINNPQGTIGESCEAVTASFSNVHNSTGTPNNSQVQSGDQGLQEAINDAQNNGGGDVFFSIDSGTPLTLSTSAQGTAFGVNIPTRSVITGSSLRVVTTITGCSGGWSLGYSSGTEFTAANATLTAGTTTDTSTINNAVAFNAAATKPEVFCTTGDATAGAVHARVWGYKHAAPAF